MKLTLNLLLALAVAVVAQAETPTPIPQLLAKIDTATGKASDTASEFTISGVISARVTLADDQVVAFVHPVGEAGVPVITRAAEATNLIPRNEVTLTGKFTDTPLGISALAVKAGSVSIIGTNKPVGISELRGADFFKDASSLAGRYVQLTNVTFTSPKFEANGVVKVKGDSGAEATLLVSKAVAGREAPKVPVNVYGIPMKTGGEWHLVSARFLPTTGKATLALATKHICITCHNPDLRLIGPAYRDVAAKYRNDPEAPAKLIAQMENGGSGKWGPIPMLPFKGKVPPDDMKQLAEWILGYRWDALLAE